MSRICGRYHDLPDLPPAPPLRIDRKLSSDMEAIEALMSLFRTYADMLCTLRRRVLQRSDDEALHRFRIHLRKSITLLGFCDLLLDREIVRQKRGMLKEIISRTNTLRDLEVLQERLEHLFQDDPIGIQSAQMARFGRRIAQECEKERRAIETFLRSDAYRLKMAIWRLFITREYRYYRICYHNRPIRPVTAYLIGFAFKKALKRMRKILHEEQEDPRLLHKLRIDFKKVRYLIEAFGALFPKKRVQKALKRLKKIQNLLGAYHDTHRHREIVERYTQLWGSEDPALQNIGNALSASLQTVQREQIEEIETVLGDMLQRRKAFMHLFA